MTANTNKPMNYTIDSQFANFVTKVLQPVSGVDISSIWDDLGKRLTRDNDTTGAPATGTDAISLSDPRLTLRSLNSRWGSLYSALYNADTIPHSAGLKIGRKYNAARGKRVTAYARDFLDATFPLTEGSHSDAVSYLVYFQNLMVILADGSTAGLRNPAQFVAKNGPKDDPESLLLQHQDLHIEILFDRNGARGAQDLSNIEDIQIEAPAITALSLEAESPEQKFAAYSNLLDLAQGRLTCSFDSNGRKTTRRLNRCVPYTLKNGDEATISCTNEAVISLDESRCELGMITDSDGNALAQWRVDAAIASWITDNFSQPQSSISLTITPRKTTKESNTRQKQTPDASVLPAVADTLPTQVNHTTNKRAPADATDNNKGVYAGNPVMVALHRHGFAQH